MASSSQAIEKIAIQDASNLSSTGELERLNNCLKEAMKKNQDLEEMLLYTAQELEKEKENSRRIVQTLTERLMEYREMINKLEVENMRYKKDCMLAVELLQCNRKVEQSEVSKTVRRLSDYDQPEPHTRGIGTNPFAIQDNKPDSTVDPKITKDETRHLQPNRPEMASIKKKKNEAGISGNNAEDTAALLEVDDEVSMHGKHLLKKEAKISNGGNMLDYHKHPSGNPFKAASDQTNMAGVPLINGTCSEGKPSDDQSSFAKETNLNNKDIRQCFTNEHEENAGSTSSTEDKLNSIVLDGTEKEGCCPKTETECLNDEEDRPLIVNEARSSKQPSYVAPKTNENTELRREHAKTKVCDDKSNVDKEINEVEEDTSLILSTETKTEDDVFHVNSVRGEPEGDNENDSLLDQRKNEGVPQEISSEDDVKLSIFVAFDEDNTVQTEDDDQEASMDHDSQIKKDETESNGKEVATKLEEAEPEDETLTGEENTPLV
ncbi:uncharacterized protein LOC114520125 [Dendronephthya gigantea]|uniref:uncharacterized protein LOC114520125 n=1 Tax=Dendronephthya gigantea TaxID=151771 RepID=UPI0010690FBB|nr:uncharacterized protein LOC114520125 [Dendronephthya gigantea]